MTKIGLFPLSIVLFPESAYPLHIFEERYKLLINECYKEKKPFGINYINSKGMNHIGCTAIVSDIFKLYSDGRMDILVAGVQRYKIINMEEGYKPYYTATIEFFDDDVSEYDLDTLNECINLFNDLASKIKTVQIDPIDIEKLNTSLPSFYISQKSGLSNDQKQALLEMRNENQRLVYLIRHLKKLSPMIHQATTISQIVKNDGYIKPIF